MRHQQLDSFPTSSCAVHPHLFWWWRVDIISDYIKQCTSLFRHCSCTVISCGQHLARMNHAPFLKQAGAQNGYVHTNKKNRTLGSTLVESVYRCEKELNRIWYFVGHSLDFSDRLLTGRRKFWLCFLKFHNPTHQKECFPNENMEDDWTSILSR